MPKLPKIWLIDRDRAMELMWIADAIYDEYKTVKYADVQDKMTSSEWAIIQGFFNNSHKTDVVIKALQYNHPLFK